jgi:hypothetical protein
MREHLGLLLQVYSQLGEASAVCEGQEIEDMISNCHCGTLLDVGGGGYDSKGEIPQ